MNADKRKNRTAGGNKTVLRPALVRPSGFPRRLFLKGAAGVCLGLPALDVCRAQAQDEPSSFALFVVHANGVAQFDADRDGEHETWWPLQPGPLDSATLTAQQDERTTGLLAEHASKLLMVRGVDHPFKNKGCAHQNWDCQLLSAATVLGSGNSALANGETVDTRIAREKNPQGREPLALRAGFRPDDATGFDNPGFISYSGSGQPRAAQKSPLIAYQSMIGQEGELSSQQLDLLRLQRKSINDLLREQISTLQSNPALSLADRERIQQHLDAVREIEVSIEAVVSDESVARMEAVDGDLLAMDNHVEVMRLQMDLLIFAVSSGYSRTATLKIGDRIDNHRYEVDGQLLPSFHQISHRIFGDGASGDPIPDAYSLHRVVDRIHALEFKRMLDRLTAISTPTGALIDQGFTAWTNQQGTGWHSPKNLPWVIAGNARGFLRNGLFVDVGGKTNNLLLNTLLSAAGLRQPNGDLIDDFGDASLERGVLPEIIA